MRPSGIAYNLLQWKEPTVPAFAYAATDQAGKIVRGRYEAENEELVAADLETSGYEVTRVAVEDTYEQDETRAHAALVGVVGYAIRKGASEIHIELGQEHGRVVYFISGEAHELLDLAEELLLPLATRIKTMADINRAQSSTPQEGHVGFKTPSKTYDLHVST